VSKWRERFLDAGEVALTGRRTRDNPTSLLEGENHALKKFLVESVLFHKPFKKPCWLS
jgi:hypothetical protein